LIVDRYPELLAAAAAAEEQQQERLRLAFEAMLRLHY
jgi:hypothetical protein